MKTDHWIALFRWLALLLSATLWPAGALSERSLFEEEQEEEGEPEVETESASSTIQVPRTAEARKLADQVLGRLASSYQTLISEGVGGFDATFSIEEEGKQIGPLAVQFKGGNISARIQGVSEEGKQEALEDLYGPDVFGVVAGGPLSAALLKGKSVYAVKAGEQFILDLSGVVSNKGGEVTSCVAFVSPDLLKIDKLIVKGDDELWATVYQGEKVNGRLLVGSSTVTIQSSGEEMAKIEHTWTYGREQGIVFLRRIRTKITSPGESVNFQIVRDKVFLEKATTLPKSPETTEDIEKEREMRLKNLDDRIRKALEEEQKKLFREPEEE